MGLSNCFPPLFTLTMLWSISSSLTGVLPSVILPGLGLSIAPRLPIHSHTLPISPLLFSLIMLLTLLFPSTFICTLCQSCWRLLLLNSSLSTSSLNCATLMKLSASSSPLPLILLAHAAWLAKRFNVTVASCFAWDSVERDVVSA
jgi:hypothetical protein